MAQPNIHSFYRIWFSWVDPLSLIPTVGALLLAPEAMMDALIPAEMSVPNPDHAFLFHQLAALYASTGIVMTGVLRVSPDIRVWKMIEAAVLLVDIAILASLFVSLNHQDRLELAKWRAQDWGNFLFTGLVAVIRTLFLAGVGARAEVKGKKTA